MSWALSGFPSDKINIPILATTISPTPVATVNVRVKIQKFKSRRRRRGFNTGNDFCNCDKWSSPSGVSSGDELINDSSSGVRFFSRGFRKIKIAEKIHNAQVNAPKNNRNSSTSELNPTLKIPVKIAADPPNRANNDPRI